MEQFKIVKRSKAFNFDHFVNRFSFVVAQGGGSGSAMGLESLRKHQLDFVAIFIFKNRFFSYFVGKNFAKYFSVCSATRIDFNWIELNNKYPQGITHEIIYY